MSPQQDSAVQAEPKSPQVDATACSKGTFGGWVSSMQGSMEYYPHKMQQRREGTGVIRMPAKLRMPVHLTEFSKQLLEVETISRILLMRKLKIRLPTGQAMTDIALGLALKSKNLFHQVLSPSPRYLPCPKSSTKMHWICRISTG